MRTVRAHIPPLDCLLFVAPKPLNQPARAGGFFAPVPHRNADRVAVPHVGPHPSVVMEFGYPATAKRARRQPFQVVVLRFFCNHFCLRSGVCSNPALMPTRYARGIVVAAAVADNQKFDCFKSKVVSHADRVPTKTDFGNSAPSGITPSSG